MAPKTGTFAKHLVITTLMLLLHFTVLAQYYPAPRPLNPEKEGSLMIALKNARSDKSKVALFLDLANIYTYRPIRKQADLNRAMGFARAASKLSSQLNDASLRDSVQLFIAEIYTLQNNMKSAESILASLNDTSKLKLLLNLSYKYWEREANKKDDDWHNAAIFAEQARKLSIQLHLRQYEILALSYIALVDYSKGRPSAESELVDVLKKYKAMRYRDLQYVYNCLAVINFRAGNPDKAEYYSMEAIQSMRATGDTTAAGDFYYWRSVISYNNEDYQKSFDFALLAINYYKIHPGEISLADRAMVFSLPVQALRRMKKYREALQYVGKIDKDYPPLNVADKIGDALITGNIYRDMKAYGKAEAYFLKALRLSKKESGVKDMSAYLNVGQLYVESKQYGKARPYLDLVWKTTGNQMSSAGKSHMNYMLYLADSAAGEYRAAMNHLADYRGLEEFNLRQVQNKEVKRLEVQYDVKEKENALKIKDQRIALLNQNYKLEEIKVKQSKMEKDITIGAILVLLTFTGLLYKQYRNKQHINRVITKNGEEILHKNEVISQKNQHLERLLHEKEWLIKEVHHRVKNNLQTIINLLESQAAYLENDALKAIETSQNRIYAMSLIHQKLYQLEHIQTISMAGYIPELVLYLKHSFDNSERIDFHLEIDPVNLDASIAIPIALIINEALTNAIKYAFPDEGPGEITISLHEQGESLKLFVGDNGIGMGKEAIEANIGSLGLQLINGLTKEIHGDISIESSPGVKITIWFKKYPLEYASLLQTNGEASA